MAFRELLILIALLGSGCSNASVGTNSATANAHQILETTALGADGVTHAAPAASLSNGSQPKPNPAPVTVPPESPSQQPVSVSISPNLATVGSGQTTQFSAVVTGASNKTVTWTARLGSMSSSGVYTAPTVAEQLQDMVTAVSAADNSEYSSASITVTPALQNAQRILSYWVAPNGSDSNDGSQNSPWATIPYADGALTLGANGTVVHVAPGTYDVSNKGFLKTSRNGTASARITFVSDTLYGAQIEDSGRSTIPMQTSKAFG